VSPRRIRRSLSPPPPIFSKLFAKDGTGSSPHRGSRDRSQNGVPSIPFRFLRQPLPILFPIPKKARAPSPTSRDWTGFSGIPVAIRARYMTVPPLVESPATRSAPVPLLATGPKTEARAGRNVAQSHESPSALKHFEPAREIRMRSSRAAGFFFPLGPVRLLPARRPPRRPPGRKACRDDGRVPVSKR